MRVAPLRRVPSWGGEACFFPEAKGWAILRGGVAMVLIAAGLDELKSHEDWKMRAGSSHTGELAFGRGRLNWPGQRSDESELQNSGIISAAHLTLQVGEPRSRYGGNILAV